jgi:hypothetical protein
MAYSLTYSGGTITVTDGTLNTNTSLSLPGRNYAGYGSSVDQNLVSMLENFAAYTSGPTNAIRGQVWFDTATNLLKVNRSAVLGAPDWAPLAVADSTSDVTFDDITATGNISAVNISASGTITTTGGLTTTVITSGSNSTAGTITGDWSMTSGSTLSMYGTDAFTVKNITTGGDTIAGSITGDWSMTNGSTLSMYGTDALTVRTITTGSDTTSGTITGDWTLTTGSTLQATYADLAERYEADATYEAGTVVEIGGDKEITAVKDELSENVFGVISHTAAYLMNAVVGDHDTHPPVALTGRIPVNVVGKVQKGSRLVSAGNGYARAATKNEITAFNVIGRALEDKTSDEPGKVLAVVTANI